MSDKISSRQFSSLLSRAIEMERGRPSALVKKIQKGRAELPTQLREAMQARTPLGDRSQFFAGYRVREGRPCWKEAAYAAVRELAGDEGVEVLEQLAGSEEYKGRPRTTLHYGLTTDPDYETFREQAERGEFHFFTHKPRP